MELLRPLFDDQLSEILKQIDLQPLSRVPSSRLESNAIPNIGRVELVTDQVFESNYKSLYLSMFHGGERERTDLITQRLSDAFAGKRNGLAPYYIIGLRDRNDEAIGGAQFSVLMLRGGENAAGRRRLHASVPFVQYIYVRAQNRRQDLSEVLHTLTLAVATAQARAAGDRVVPFTLFETEPPNYGVGQSAQTNATERTTIHTRSGATAMMLRSRRDGRLITSHVQPGLEHGEKPITLIWVLRKSPLLTEYDVNDVGSALIAAYYQSLRDEGFPEANIALAERIAAYRCKDADFCVMPLSDVRIEMYQGLEDESVVH